MRSDDTHQDSTLSYLSPEARVLKDRPLRPLRQMVNQALREFSGDFQAYVCPGGTSLHPAGEVTAGPALATLHHPQRTPAHGPDRDFLPFLLVPAAYLGTGPGESPAEFFKHQLKPLITWQQVRSLRLSKIFGIFHSG
jgi:hypothetical protein